MCTCKSYFSYNFGYQVYIFDTYLDKSTRYHKHKSSNRMVKYTTKIQIQALLMNYDKCFFDYCVKFG